MRSTPGTWSREPLATRFRRALKASGDAIGQHPLAFPKVHGDVRRALLKRFPYCLFYVVDEDAVVVLGCFHGHRNPATWEARLDGS